LTFFLRKPYFSGVKPIQGNFASLQLNEKYAVLFGKYLDTMMPKLEICVNQNTVNSSGGLFSACVRFGWINL